MPDEVPQKVISMEAMEEKAGAGFLPGLGFLVKVIIFLVASWFLVHAFAIFGVFFAIAYPLWYIFSPNNTVCLLCRFHTGKYTCPLCKRTVGPGDSKVPASLYSAVMNGLIITSFSFISLGFVFVEKVALNELGFPPTQKTVTFEIPSEGEYKIGEIFSMEIKIKGIKVPINAVQADFQFDPHVVEVVDILTDVSFADVFIQKSINNEIGYARLTGGLPNPGYDEEEGAFGTVMFRGKSSGVVEVEFLPTSLVLANDGEGTNVLKELASASYLILPDRLTEDELSLQEDLLEENVLGQKTERTKLEFYDESEAEVLGIEDELFEEEPSTIGGISIWDLIEKVDSLIIALWDWIVGLFD